MYNERELARIRAEEQEAGTERAKEVGDLIAKGKPYEDILKTRAYPDGNPKTLMGAKKPDPSVIPPCSILHLATAMMNGAAKYGPFNWRDQSISSRPYVAAATRHLLAYLDGENYSADTTEAGAPVHHLAHVMACCAILLDAGELNLLNDNRPEIAGTAGELIEHFNKTGSLARKPV